MLFSSRKKFFQKTEKFFPQLIDMMYSFHLFKGELKMGASYVAGTAPGTGAAFPGQRGPGNNRDVFQAAQAVGGVVAAGVLGSTTSATVTLASFGLTQPSSAYAVFAQAQGANVEIAISKDTAATFTTFTVAPASAAVVGWMVVRA